MLLRLLKDIFQKTRSGNNSMANGDMLPDKLGQTTVKHHHKSTNNFETDINSSLEKAIDYLENGHIQEAKLIYQAILQKNPGQSDALYQLAIITLGSDAYDTAITYLDKAINANPDNALYYISRGDTHQLLQQHNLAGEDYRKAIELKPDLPQAHYHLGNLYLDLEIFDEAISCYRQTIKLNPEIAEVHNNLGLALYKYGDLQESIKYYEKALSLNSRFAGTHNNLGLVFQDLGNFEKAVTHFEKSLEIKPEYAEVYRHLVALGPIDRYIENIKAIVDSDQTPDYDKVHLYFAMGKYFNGNKEYEKAFEYFSKANDLKRQDISYYPDTHTSYINSLIKAYSHSFYVNKSKAGLDSEIPVFIVGMPRSGTTLVEQIISSHPEVHGGGELGYLSSIENTIRDNHSVSVEYPYSLELIEQNQFKSFANQYLTAIQVFSSHCSRVTDKLPDNFLRIGLIKILFPKAKIIHCQRNALDTCLSIFFNYFAGHNNYAYTLEDIGKYYIDYLRIMRHWSELFPSEIMTLQYEELIKNQEMISKQLLDYIGLQWDDRCLEFYNNDRAVRTNSNVQVRRSIYTSSINIWKNYEKHSKPLKNILTDDAVNTDQEIL